jgi:poly(A) polymerase
VFDARIGDISGRGKLAADMREIWLMQPRFERRTGNGPFALVEQPRFRAGFDFLRLRADAGESDPELARWWEEFSLADEEKRARLVEQLRGPGGSRRRAPAAAAAPAAAEGEGDSGFPEGSSDAPRKRRRRRRKPAGGGAGDAAPPSNS